MTRTRASRRTPGAMLALLLLGLLPIACSPAGAGATPTAAAPTSRPTVAPATAPASTIEASPQLPGTSESSLGPIWNELPDSFPVPTAAAEADAPQGPVSGAWTVPVADMSAPDLVGFYRNAIDELGWSPIVDGPLEDGSYTVYSSDGYGCETLTTILPRGDESLITVLFGAGCPFR